MDPTVCQHAKRLGIVHKICNIQISKAAGNHKSPGFDQIHAELIKAGVVQFAVGFINLSLLFGIRRNCLKSGRSRS